MSQIKAIWGKSKISKHVKSKEPDTISLFDRPFVLSMGPQRAGTSWLDRYLRSRGDVCMPDGVKEIFFFDRHYSRGAAFYTSHFKPEPDHKCLMEISTTSFDHPDAPERVKALLGDELTMICPLRHPINRSYSLYQHFLRYGIVTGSLQEASEQIPQILYSSRYADHLSRWIEVFGHDKIHIVYQEDLEADQDGFVRQLCDILGLSYMPPEGEIAAKMNVTTVTDYPQLAGFVNAAADILRKYKLYSVINFGKSLGLKRLIFGKEDPDAKKGEIPAQDYEWLRERLFDEVPKLEALLGHEIDSWRR